MEQTITIKDIGEYSIFVQKKMPIEIAALGIRRWGSNKWYISIEIVKTEEGTVVYFNTRVDNIFKKGHIYPMIMLDTLGYDVYLRIPELLEIISI